MLACALFSPSSLFSLLLSLSPVRACQPCGLTALCAEIRFNYGLERFCTLFVGHAGAQLESSVTVKVFDSGAYTVKLELPQILLRDELSAAHLTHAGPDRAALAGTRLDQWCSILASEEGPSFFKLTYDKYSAGETTEFGVKASMSSLRVVYRSAFLEVVRVPFEIFLW